MKINVWFAAIWLYGSTVGTYRGTEFLFSPRVNWARKAAWRQSFFSHVHNSSQCDLVQSHARFYPRSNNKLKLKSKHINGFAGVLYLVTKLDIAFSSYQICAVHTHNFFLWLILILICMINDRQYYFLSVRRVFHTLFYLGFLVKYKCINRQWFYGSP